MSYKQIDGVHVVVDQVVFMPSLHSPADKPYPFVYFVSINNDSEETIRILGRKWVVDEHGYDSVVVEGDGVVGETPTLPPGESFSYNSYHVVAHTAEASGAFYGVTAKGEKMMVEIPPFTLKVPLK